jgi:hypothetical protein
MKSPVRAILLLAAFAVTPVHCAAQGTPGAPLHRQALLLIDQTNAVDVDPTLPSEPLNTWLKRTAHVNDIVWELDETCGAGSAAGVAEHTCLQTTLHLLGGEEATLLLAFEQVDGRLAAKPRVRIVSVDFPDGSHYRDSDRLSDLPQLIGN